MRLLITTDPIGGVWTYTRELTEALLSAGHSVSLLSFGRALNAGQQSWVQATAARSASFRFAAHALALEWQQSNHSCYESTAPLLLKEVDRFAPDLLHVNQFCYGALPVPVPRLVVAHSDVLSWHQACRGTLPEPSAWIDTYRTLVQTGLDHATYVVAPTQAMLRALSGNFRVSAPSGVLPNGRLLPPVPPVRRRMQAVTLGRLWDEGKNLRLLEEVSFPMPLLVAGEQHHEQSAWQPLGVHLLGALEAAELHTLLAESTVYIAPSLYEPFGLAPLEAALSGCALLLNDLPSFHEVWGDNALYFRSARELETLLRACASRPALAHSFGDRAREHALAHYSREKMLEGYLPLYTQLTATHEAAAHVA